VRLKEVADAQQEQLRLHGAAVQSSSQAAEQAQQALVMLQGLTPAKGSEAVLRLEAQKQAPSPPPSPSPSP